MSIVARICLGILALGILIGLLNNGIAGGTVGFFLAVAIAIPVYCITKVVQRDAAVVNKWEDPFSDVPSSSRKDPSQLPKGAYNPRNGMI